MKLLPEAGDLSLAQRLEKSARLKLKIQAGSNFRFSIRHMSVIDLVISVMARKGYKCVL